MKTLSFLQCLTNNNKNMKLFTRKTAFLTLSFTGIVFLMSFNQKENYEIGKTNNVQVQFSNVHSLQSGKITVVARALIFVGRQAVRGASFIAAELEVLTLLAGNKNETTIIESKKQKLINLD